MKRLSLTALLTLMTLFTAISAAPYASYFTEVNNTIKYKSKSFDTTIYVDADSGSDSNSGESPQSAIQSLDKLSTMDIQGGYQILLCGGQQHIGTIELVGLNNDSKGKKRIHIGSYGDGKATINSFGYPAAVKIFDSSYIDVTDIKIVADGGPAECEGYMYRAEDAAVNNRHAIWINATEDGVTTKDLYIYNVDMNDIYYFPKGDANIPSERPCRMWSTTGESRYGWGIKADILNDNAAMDQLVIEECNVKDISHTAYKIIGSGGGRSGIRTPITNFTITKSNAINVGGPGMQFAFVRGCVMNYSRTLFSGNRDEARKWGRGSGVWIHNCDGVLFEYNHHEGSEGIADCCGAHIDVGNKNVIIQYCFSKNNAGGFVEILDRNENCTYRYNVSLNDGWRNTHDPLQDKYWDWRQPKGNVIGTHGCLLTLSGFIEDRMSGPYNAYIYNNTIICTEGGNAPYENPYIFEISPSTVRGALITNNIFWVPSQMGHSWSNHTIKNGEPFDEAYDFRITTGADSDGKAIVRDMTAQEIEDLNFVIRNNIYQLYDPSAVRGENLFTPMEAGPCSYWEDNALGGDPKFVNINGSTPEDFTPTDADVIQRGEKIEQLKSDKTTYGVSSLPQAEAKKYGLDVTTDIFGNKITKPIVGAIVPQK